MPNTTIPNDFDVTIIGGGVIGLAIARRLATHSTVLLVERHRHFGSETSSRNSEVIHAGLYYSAGSLKESLCIKGKEALYAYCDAFDVPFQRTGKLIVSPVAEHPQLARLEHTAQRLKIPLQRLSCSELQALEPHVRGQEALLSPTTGVIDSHVYMQRLEQHATEHKAVLVNKTGFISAQPTDSGWEVLLSTQDGNTTISTSSLINAAGLQALSIARHLGMSLPDLRLYPCRGHYFSHQGKSPFQHLIYPLPEPNLTGLGIHATVDLSGFTRFGPDTEYLRQSEIQSDRYCYSVDEQLKQRFVNAIQRYYPNLDPKRLQPDYAGIRPKLHAQNHLPADFNLLSGSAELPPVIHLLGIESPGLTASLAIADHIEQTIARLSSR